MHFFIFLCLSLTYTLEAPAWACRQCVGWVSVLIWFLWQDCGAWRCYRALCAAPISGMYQCWGRGGGGNHTTSTKRLMNHVTACIMYIALAYYWESLPAHLSSRDCVLPRPPGHMTALLALFMTHDYLLNLRSCDGLLPSSCPVTAS